MEGAESEADRKMEKEKRIQARRKRVEIKLEAKRRAEAGEEPEEVEDEVVDEEKERISWKQVEKSALRLDKLSSDGSELVSNVMVAEDAREIQCRQQQAVARNSRYERLEAEATAGEERIEEIMKKWSSSKSSTIPQEVQKLLQQQKAACDAMMDEKDKLSNELQQELKSQDDQYVKYLKKQAEEVDLIMERMEEQAHTLLRAHRQEMSQIESSFATERETLRDTQKSEWEEAVAKRQSQEASFLARRDERIEENEAKLQHLRRRNMQDYNEAKIKKETDIQTLQQQIQQMKATYLLNTEKLEYNFQVLKKRDEENTATISLQKRRITRLQDTQNQLNTRLRRQSKSQQAELQALMEEYRKNTEQYRDIQKKARHFQLSDAKLFQEVWQMNEEQVQEVSSEVLEADRVVHAQQLGLEWEKPQTVVSPLERALATARSKMSQATIYASQVLSETSFSGEEDRISTTREQEEEGEKDVEVSMAGSRKVGERSVDKPKAHVVAQTYPPSTVKRVLELLCREAGFLLDEKLIRLVAPLPKEEQMMMKLDSMFKSLSVHTEDDIQHLITYFIHEEGEDDDDRKEEEEQEEQEEEDRKVEGEETDAEYQADGESEKGDTLSEPALIHPNDIPSALRRFVSQRKSTSKPLSFAPSTLGLSSAAQKELLDGSFWQQMAGILPQSHKRVWDALLEGLEQYHSILVSRYKCKEETQALTNQNVELRLLLQQYMHSRINQELEIPPTLMLPS